MCIRDSPTPKFGLSANFHLVGKFSSKNVKSEAENTHFQANWNFFITYNDFYQKSAAVWIVRNLWYMLKGCNFMSRVRCLTTTPLKQMFIISHFQNWQSPQFSSSILQVLTSFLHTEHDEHDEHDAVGWTSAFCRTVQTGCQWTVSSLYIANRFRTKTSGKCFLKIKKNCWHCGGKVGHALNWYFMFVLFWLMFKSLELICMNLAGDLGN